MTARMGETGTLDQCATVHMASDRDWIARCGRIAREAGVGESYPYLGVEDIARRVRKTPVQFLIVHYELERSVLADTVKAVRHHHDNGVKFMPIVVFTRDSSAPALRDFLKMGFDDIICFPCTVAYLAGRLAHQIGHRLDYLQTETYCGPDRQRLFEDEVEAGAHGGQQTHFAIQRDPAHGIKILAQEHHGARHAG